MVGGGASTFFDEHPPATIATTRNPTTTVRIETRFRRSGNG
jgi:hypothetical protein